MMRLFVAAFVLVGGTFATHSLKPKEVAGQHRRLIEFPSAIGLWQGEDLPFDDAVVESTGADDYINRIYSGSTPPIELYIGYYKNQDSGDSIHSPKNCLPGSGWEPISSAQLQIGSVDGRPAFVNEYLVEQGTHRDMVLYWYQTHTRIIASEYWAKFWLVADGLERRSTDGAMIRIWTTAADGQANAQIRAIDFARQVYPQVAAFLPDPKQETSAERIPGGDSSKFWSFPKSFKRGAASFRAPVFPGTHQAVETSLDSQ